MSAPVLDIHGAARRLEGVIRETPLVPFPYERGELRLKLECVQETGAFKARGAWNQIARLSSEERARGVVAVSSGNHAKALSWAAKRAGVRATVVMPADAYANKIAACRELGAEVVLAATRDAADEACRERVARGLVLVHPFDDAKTAEGQGTVGLEIARAWPEVETVVVPCGGGGLLSGCAVALRSELGKRVRVVGVEPAGAPKMTKALAAGEPVRVAIATKIQGLCPPAVGAVTLALVREHVDEVATIEDEPVFAAQKALVRAGYTVEPAGAAALAFVLERKLTGRIAVVVSGGNPDPSQLAAIRS